MEYELVGWREHVTLTTFKLQGIKAKIDTGAKSSALHAEEITFVTENHRKYVKFVFTHEDGRRSRIKARFIEERSIKSSTGQMTVRPVVRTKIKLGKFEFEIELTLINRDLMGFKMLIGRDALNHRFLINPSKSYLLKE